jgi:putative Holliday junction resolvase
VSDGPRLPVSGDGPGEDSDALLSTGLARQGRIAGVDFGTVRIGVAVSDFSQTISSPLEVYQRRSVDLDGQYFVDLVKRESIVGFVVGLPVHMSGQASEKSRQAVQFGNWLRRVTRVPVTWFDERFTTTMAREILNQSPLSGKKRKAMLDKLAAQILLSAYLESPQKAANFGETDSLND